jgi:macrolide-specific efflux system membrane fusion protein
VKPGQRVYFTILGEPDNKISATLRSIEPAPSAIDTADNGISSTDSAVYYNGLFEVPNPDHKLRIAMTTQVSIVLNEVKGGLVIPSSALRGGRNGNYIVAVYDPKAGTTHPARVKVGINNNVLASVDSGLNEGDLVVVSGTGGAGPGFGPPGQNGQNRQNGANPNGNRPGNNRGGGALRGLGGAGGGAPLGL